MYFDFGSFLASFMKCSFDQKEYCPLEHFNKGNTHWKLNSTEAINLLSYYKIKSSPRSGMHVLIIF